MCGYRYLCGKGKIAQRKRGLVFQYYKDRALQYITDYPEHE